MPGRPGVVPSCSIDVILSSSSNSFHTVHGLQEILQYSASVALLFSGERMWMATATEDGNVGMRVPLMTYVYK